MNRILTKTCLLFASLLISVISFGQQGGQNPPDSSSSQAAQANKNDDFSPVLQPGESYPVNQNLEFSKKNQTDSLKQLSPDKQNIEPKTGVQGQGAPGVQNAGNPPQNSQPANGKQSVPGNTGMDRDNPVQGAKKP